MGDSKPFPPSKRKLQKAREEGNVPKSQHFIQLIEVVAIICFALFLGSVGLVKNQILLEYWLVGEGMDSVSKMATLGKILFEFLTPCLVFGALIAILLSVSQIGFRLVPTSVAPRWSRIDIGGGLKRLGKSLRRFPFQASRDILFGILILRIAWCCVWRIPELFLLPQEAMYILCEDILLGCGGIIFTVSAALGVIDFLLSRKRFYSEFSMSMDEVRREHKEDEGDPFLKAFRRAMQLQLSREEIIRRVRQSKVIVVERNEVSS